MSYVSAPYSPSQASCEPLQPELVVVREEKRPRFVQLQADVVHQDANRLGLTPNERALFVELLLAADWQTALIRKFSLTHFAEAQGYGSQSGRRTLRTRLSRLSEAGLIHWKAPPGRSWGGRGVVQIVSYDRYVKRDLAKALRLSRADLTARSSPDKSGLTARSSTNKRPLNVRPARGYPVEHPLLAAVSSDCELTRQREDRKKDPLPTPPDVESEARQTPEREGSETQGREALVAAVEVCTGAGLVGMPVKRLGALADSFPEQVPQLCRMVEEDMRGLRSFNRVIERLEEAAGEMRSSSERRNAERAQMAEATRQAELVRQARSHGRKLAVAGHEDAEIEEELLATFELPDLVAAGLDEARETRFRQSGAPKALLEEIRTSLRPMGAAG